MRLFLALWPSATASSRILEIQDAVKGSITRQGVRFTRPERIHLTLHFYGDVSESRLPELKERLSQVEAARFEVRTTILGGFPSLQRPRIVWLGLEGEGLVELQAQAAEAVTGLVEPAEEMFKPHLTLARLNPGSKEAGRLVQSLPKEIVEPPAVWTVDSISLMETLPTSAYEEIHRIQL